MVFNATFNNISVMSWQSVLLVEEIRVPGESTNLLQVTDKLLSVISWIVECGIKHHNPSPYYDFNILYIKYILRKTPKVTL
jgi:hypothetical protein